MGEGSCPPLRAEPPPALGAALGAKLGAALEALAAWRCLARTEEEEAERHRHRALQPVLLPAALARRGGGGGGGGRRAHAERAQEAERVEVAAACAAMGRAGWGRVAERR